MTGTPWRHVLDGTACAADHGPSGLCTDGGGTVVPAYVLERLRQLSARVRAVRVEADGYAAARDRLAAEADTLRVQTQDYRPAVVAKAIRAGITDCPLHGRRATLAAERCPVCARNRALVWAARIVEGRNAR